MTLYENTITRGSSLDKKDGIQEAYEKMLFEANYDLTFLDDKGKIIYSGAKSGIGLSAKNTKDAVKKAKENIKDFPGAKKVRLAVVRGNKASKIGEFDLNESLNEANLMTVDDFLKGLESTIKKVFPNSYINAKASTNLGASIHLTFALGKNKSEWQNGIIENDPLLHRWMIGWNSFTEGHFVKDKIVAELSVGGTLKVNPEEGSYMALGSVKIGWRKKTAPPDKLITYFGNYFKKVKKVTKDNKYNMTTRDLELIGKKI